MSSGNGALQMPTDTAIAIVGMGCRFPGAATSPEKLWELCSSAKSAWSEIPPDRFNKDAFYHTDGGRTGTTNARGGHFLLQDIGLFDAPFFNVSAEEAKAMDPQLRLQLETCYEALENGTDYSESMMRDIETLPRYSATGTGGAMLANRVSYFFDLKGPSLTVDTGCSTSLVALHLACQSIRAGESEAALVGGSNIILNPDMLITLSNMGFLSSEGRSFAFDHRANGYGRGEGAACIVIKPLNKAISDGDYIHSIIRQTAVNSDGKTDGITQPSAVAHENLIRRAYHEAKLDPLDTDYVEAHGTGTQAGDPLELKTVASIFGSTRKNSNPIYVGSVKTNVGHLEAASGLAGIIKASLAMQKGIIPPNINFEKLNEKIVLDKYYFKIPSQPTPWPTKTGPRRASVNSLGYGGTNAHVILEDANELNRRPKGYSNGKINGFTNGTGRGVIDGTVNGVTDASSNGISDRDVDEVSNGTSSETTDGTFRSINGGSGTTNAPFDRENTETGHIANKWRFFTLSAKDEDSLKDTIASMRDHLESYRNKDSLNEESFLDNLAYTLCERRSSFRWIQAFTSQSLDGLISTLGSRKPAFSIRRRAESPHIGFIFTGQGAQWHAMGRELLHAYPVFRRTLELADAFLSTQNCPWSLLEELNRDVETTKINSATIGQPLCTAVQIGLVNLLEAWNIRPTAVTGHSSGEIASAFAAGALTLESAMLVAYHRGANAERSASLSGIKGGMIAVGLSRERAEDYIERLKTGKVVVACINSPSSVTVSGDLVAIEEIQKLLDADEVFARRLKVDAAYHSHHMLLAVDGYVDQLNGMETAKQMSPNILCISSVTGKPVQSAQEFGPSYWEQNAVQPVLFSDALTCLCQGGASEEKPQNTEAFVDILLEIGPHGALAGPVRQILQASSLKQTSVSYLSCLMRNQDAHESMMNIAASLLCKGAQVNLEEVNFPCGKGTVSVVPDLPSYPWAHEIRHWHEPRINRQQRLRQHARHGLLGILIPGQNPAASTWRHFVRLSDQPWVRDHVVDSNILYPAAGFIAMAIEAVSQKHHDLIAEGARYHLQELNFVSALAVPDTADGVEIQLSLFPTSEQLLKAQKYYEFRILSVGEKDEWHEHCSGRIGLQIPSAATSWKLSDRESTMTASAFESSERLCTRTIDVKKYYEGVHRLGINYGQSFQNLVKIQQGPSRSLTTVQVRDTAALMPSHIEQRHVIHPTTLDAILQSIYPALSDNGTEHKTIMIPTYIKSLSVSQAISHAPGSQLRVNTNAERNLRNGAKASLTVIHENETDRTPVIRIEELVLTSIGISVEDIKGDSGSELCFNISFDRDISFMTSHDFSAISATSVDPAEQQISTDLQRACFHMVEQALKKLTEADISRLTGPQLAMFNWMKTQYELGQQGFLDFQASTSPKISDEEQDNLITAVETQTVNGEMCVRVGKYLVQILRKEIEPLQVMMEDGLLYKYYENALGMKRVYAHMSSILRLFAHKTPGANILEIGGGTGGCTVPALQALTSGDQKTPRFAHYTFTDVSSGFFEKAREKLVKWEDRVSYKRFDVEIDPESQDIQCGSYDLVIACNVLHATVDMEKTMSNVRKLIRSGGRLLVIEGTRDTLDISLVFGVLPGWWLGQEEERRLSPKLSVTAWDSLLKRTGFSGQQALMLDSPTERDHVYSVYLANATPDIKTKSHPQTSIVLGMEQPPETWLAHLVSSLQAATGHCPIISSFESPAVDGKVAIFLGEMNKSILARLGQDDFLALRKMLTTAKGVLWMTVGGSMECSSPESAMVTGLMRTLRGENAGIRLATLDLDPTRQPFTIETSKTITKIFLSVFDPELESVNVDLEYSDRGDQIFIPRVLPDPQANQALQQTSGQTVLDNQEFYQEDRPLCLEVSTAGLLDTMRFVDDVSFREALPADFVEIAPKAFGLNFRDVMIAMGHLNETTMGYECSGVITRVGSNITHLQPGDRVAAMMQGHYANYIRLLGVAVSKIPDNISFEEATSMPMVFTTAYFSLYETARLQKGETVLIHAAAGGVGQAAIMLAQLVGAEVYATVGSNDKCRLLIENYGIPEDHIFSSRNDSFTADIIAATNGRGVDVALNCLSGSLLHATWKCMAIFGRLVEIGKRDIETNTCLDMGGFQGNVSFSAIDLTYMGRFRPAHLASILEKCMQLFSEGKIHAVKPITVFPISEIERAFRYMQAGKHSGKVVIKPNKGDVVKALAPRVKTLFRADSSYVIVGGLGGLGQSLARWMIKLGAKYLIILSRSGRRHALAASLSADAEQSGCKVLILECDITNEFQVQRSLDDAAQTMLPIRGIIQGAMVLNDCVFEHMSFEQYQNAVLPKVQGTWNLHNALLQNKLDFFVMLSSAVGVVGNSSQANYSAGSSFLDALAQYRRSLGLRAISLDLGIISSVGYVAENEAVAKRLARMGHDAISEEKMLGLIQIAVTDSYQTQQSQSPCQILTGLSLRELDADWIQDTKFSIIRQSQASSIRASSNQSSQRGLKISLQDRLNTIKSETDAVTVICDAIISKLAINLMVPEADIDPEQAISACGVDSLVAVELRNWLGGQAGAEISVVDILQCKSLVGLSASVARSSKVVAKVIGLA
ncbi:reducing type I polyketide synthase [Coleophoma crateriformis]|uniref:Reducing type I polyketide synthase n=1 Tax=Coleophoma crateriformis TaxID=565419 RepID=A0A3D8RI31_9HELO|nr:reducing type I polyketide synthase [Coleophoma crateriformis]